MPVSAPVMPAMNVTKAVPASTAVAPSGGRLVGMGRNALAGAGRSAAGVLGATRGIIQKPFSLSFMGMMGGGLAGGLGKGVQFAAGSSGKVASWAGEKTGVDALSSAGEAVQQGGLKAGEGLGNVGQWLGAPQRWLFQTPTNEAAEGVNQLVDQAADRIENRFGQFGESVGGAIHTGVDGVRHSESFVANSFGNTVGKYVPEDFKEKFTNQPVFGAMMQTGAAVGVAAQDIHAVTNLVDHMDGLKSLYADLNGKNPEDVTMKEALFDKDVSPLYESSRRSFVDALGPTAVLTLASNYVSLKVASRYANGGDIGLMPGAEGNGMGGAMAMAQLIAIPMITQALTKSVTPNDTTLRLHEALHQEYEQTGQLAPESIATMMVNAVPNLKGTMPDNAYVQQVATQYAQEGISPAELMNEISEGRVSSRMYILTEEIREQKAQQRTTKPDAPAETPDTVGLQQMEALGPLKQPELSRAGAL